MLVNPRISRTFALAAALCAPCHALAAASAPSFDAITYADVEKLRTRSGCSFSVHRGDDVIAFFDTQEKPPGKPQFWFKIGGKMTKVRGAATKSARDQVMGVWNGKVAGYGLRITEGRIDPTFRNDGGSIGGEGRIEWSGPAKGSMPVRWESGC